MEMQRKTYKSPRLIPIGDMSQSTLGASGNQSDGAGFQAGGNGNSSNRTRQSGTAFDRSVFDKSVFDKK